MDASVAVPKFLQQTLAPFYEKYKIEYGAGLYTYLCLRDPHYYWAAGYPD